MAYNNLKKPIPGHSPSNLIQGSRNPLVQSNSNSDEGRKKDEQN